MFAITRTLAAPYLVACVALCGISLQSAAQTPDASGDEAIRIIKRHISYDVHADGTATADVFFALSPRKRSAIDFVGQQTLTFQEGMSTVEILEAYTLKQNGRRIDVAADRILAQSPPAFANSPMYSDMKMLRMVFADVDVGDQVVYRYKRRWTTPLFPGQFFDTELYPRSARYDDVKITLKHPKTYPLQTQARGLIEGTTQESDGNIVREWTFQSATVLPDEPGAVSPFDRDPLFEVSSFKSWADIAAAYDDRARDKAAVTPEIKKLADEITKGVSGKKQQALAIYLWVIRNIRYVAVYLGAGGYVPHTAASIMSNRYGDCKDYTTIMSALLDAKGIDNEPVIIEATTRFTLPEVPTPAAFNHAISYLPDLQLYLDATARQLPFGSLSGMEANKFVLHTRKFKGLVKTPSIQQSTRTMTSKSILKTTDDGSLAGSTLIDATGTMGTELAAFVDRMENPQFAKQLSTMLLSMEGLTGTADIARASPTTLFSTSAYKADMNLQNWINVPGPGAARLPSGLMSMNSIRMVATQVLNSPPAKMNRVCLPGTVEEIAEIQLPGSVKPTRIPKNVEASNPMGTYTSKYVQDGTKITITRKLEMKFPTTICKPEQIDVYRELLEQVRRDTSAQMTYE